MRPQHNEKTYRLCMSYSLTSMSCASGVSIPYFKITAPLYPASSSFPKNISTPRLGKHIVRHTINYHPSPWRLTSLTNINNRIGIIVKCICGSKKKNKRNYSFLLMLPWQNSPKGSYHWPPPNSHPPSIKLLIHPGSSIFWKPPLVERKGERRKKKLSILKNVFYFKVNSVV